MSISHEIWQNGERVLKTDSGLYGTVKRAGHLVRVDWDNGMIGYYDQNRPSNIENASIAGSRGRSHDFSTQVPFYDSSNGDGWFLSVDRAFVIHRPSPQSGGKTSSIGVEIFLRQVPAGPQHQALKAFFGNGETSPSER